MFDCEFAPQLAAVTRPSRCSRRSSWSTTATRRRRCPRHARRGRVRGRARRRVSRARLRAPLGRRPVHRLHRRHHGEPEGRDVARRRHLLRRARQAEASAASRSPSPEQITDDSTAGLRCHPACPLMHGTGQWVALGHALHRRHRRAPPRPSPRPAAHLGAHRPREGRVPRDRRRRVRAPADRGARPPRPVGRPLVAHRRALRRRDPVAGDPRAGCRSCPARSSSTASARRRRARRARRVTAAGGPIETAPRFRVNDETIVLDDDLGPAPVGVVGKLARRGHVPLGYYKDPEKTAATFPVIDGVRWSVPGDHARPRGRRHDHRARARLGVDQHRWREGVPRGGRAAC